MAKSFGINPYTTKRFHQVSYLGPLDRFYYFGPVFEFDFFFSSIWVDAKTFRHLTLHLQFGTHEFEKSMREILPDFCHFGHILTENQRVLGVIGELSGS